MNQAMKDYANSVMNSPDKYQCIADIEKKLLVFKNIDVKYPSLHDMYTFIIWDEKESGYVNCMMNIESFCGNYLMGIDLMRKFATKSIKMDSSGVKEINYTNEN